MQTYTWADHRVFDTEEGAVLFGVDHSSLFAFDREVRDAVRRWCSVDPICLDEVRGPDREVLEGLCDARILVPRKSAGARPAAPDPATIPLGTLVLEVAQDCNLRCAYCYAGGGSYGGEPRLLSPDLARRAAKFLVESSGDRGQVTLVLFGGEPLLNFPAIQAAVEEAEAGANTRGKRLNVSLTTNGTRFTPQIVDFLREHRISLSVSIDGPPDIHDRNRRRAGGGGTYADVLAGLDLLRAHGEKPPAARVTLTPDQWHRVPEVFDHLSGLGFLEVGIAPASPVTIGLLPSDEEEEALFSGFSSLAERFLREAEAGRVLPFSNLLDLLGRLHLGRAKAAPCGAGLGYLAADASGRFFLCHRLAGEETFRVGGLDTGIDPDRIRACLEEQAAPRAEMCSACWARTLCAGGCHYENHLREAQLGMAPGGPCGFVRRWLELGVRLYSRLRGTTNHSVLAFLAGRAEG